MDEFKKGKKKVPVSIKVDADVHEKAKEQNLNVSAICQYALKLAIKGKLMPPNKKGA